MENKPMDPKGPLPEPVKPADKPATPPLSGGAPQSPPSLSKPASPVVKATPPAKPAPAASVKKTSSSSKKKAKVTPAEASKLRVALVEKLDKTADGLRTVELAKALNISPSKLTFIASELIKEGKIEKLEVKDRIVYCIKGAKAKAPDAGRDKIFAEVQAMLKASPKGMNIADIATKTKQTRQTLAAALKPHVDSGEMKKVEDVYMLTGKPPIEPAKKAETADKPPLKKEPEIKEPPKIAPPKPPVRPAYTPPQKQSSGKGMACLAILISIISIILWLTTWGDSASTQDSIASLRESIDQKTTALNSSMGRMYKDMDAKVKLADLKVLNTYFNQQITDLETTLVHLDSIAKMTDDEMTHAEIAKTKEAINSLIDQLRVEYSRTIPK
ncbi:MAG: hypothetical protein JW941_01610 [Candidatus Coatesbacteria bacterium]|nr:hypothetical protein [Candidatus Coatesbacteria bacterium]